jgi:23S rRNA (cytosine1962-C5)-methyltransferase
VGPAHRAEPEREIRERGGERRGSDELVAHDAREVVEHRVAIGLEDPWHRGLDPRGHEFVAADAFAFLDDAARAGRRWDVVISDPPSFAPSEKVVPRALASYRRLHRAAAGVVAPGGMLCAASCSSHVPMEAFAATLDDASIGRSDLSLVAAYGAPEDHPTLAGWPEGRYLKLCVLT